ncbi:hypothetical protein Rrhod_0769 [Rhodococcus rhodnii LMG 5362]|uniref:Uncharacterized protein n=1 Tax=Rhodococcus rhodnii LMG 5362 TaxID=1273125 RepID=R7WRF5_9NOCA|nr:hypothetical protein Rrhod_0769 [Rhodococcus rhodnii LMG 5362]
MWRGRPARSDHAPNPGTPAPNSWLHSATTSGNVVLTELKLPIQKG